MPSGINQTVGNFCIKTTTGTSWILRWWKSPGRGCLHFVSRTCYLTQFYTSVARCIYPWLQHQLQHSQQRHLGLPPHWLPTLTWSCDKKTLPSRPEHRPLIAKYNLTYTSEQQRRNSSTQPLLTSKCSSNAAWKLIQQLQKNVQTNPRSSFPTQSETTQNLHQWHSAALKTKTCAAATATPSPKPNIPQFPLDPTAAPCQWFPGQPLASTATC